MSKPAAQLRQTDMTGNVQRLTSDEAVRNGTGRGWEEWLAVLDEWGGAEREHGEIAAWLMQEHGLSGWWTQTITVTYERERGLRAPGSSRDGLFEASASKTVAVPVERLFEAFVDPERASAGCPAPAARAHVAARPLGALRLGGRLDARGRRLHGEGRGQEPGLGRAPAAPGRGRRRARQVVLARAGRRDEGAARGRGYVSSDTACW